MSFDRVPGHGSLFRNDRKVKDTHPDYKGSICLPDGSTVNIAGWVTQGSTGKYLALKIGSVLPPVADEGQR